MYFCHRLNPGPPLAVSTPSDPPTQAYSGKGCRRRYQATPRGGGGWGAKRACLAHSSVHFSSSHGTGTGHQQPLMPPSPVQPPMAGRPRTLHQRPTYVPAFRRDLASFLPRASPSTGHHQQAFLTTLRRPLLPACLPDITAPQALLPHPPGHLAQHSHPATSSRFLVRAGWLCLPRKPRLQARYRPSTDPAAPRHPSLTLLPGTERCLKMSCRGPGTAAAASQPPSRYHARCLALPKTPASHRDGATLRPTPPLFSAPRDIAVPQEVSTGQGQATTTSDLLSFPHAHRSLVPPALPPPREQGRYRPSTAPSYYYAMTSLLLPHHQTGGLDAHLPTFVQHHPTWHPTPFTL